MQSRSVTPNRADIKLDSASAQLTRSIAPRPWQNIPDAEDQLATRVLSQDPTLLGAARNLAQAIAQEPVDARYGGTNPRALIVGGFVRDGVMDLRPKDLDLEVYGVHLDRLTTVLSTLFPGRIDAVGRAFGVLKVHLGEGRELDVSIPRRDSKQGTGHTGFVVHGDPGMSVAEAAARRDFSWNALAACPITGSVIDSFAGLADLRRGVLRVTSPTLFTDDPLRVYRAAQFAARMQLEIEAESFLLMRSIVERQEFHELPRERVTEEFKKLLLKSPAPSIGFEVLRRLGITEQRMPAVHALIGTPQDPEWHPEGDVWTHTMMVVDAAARIIHERPDYFSADEKLTIMLSAVAHDLGKPATTKFIDGRFRSHGHERAGVIPAGEWLQSLMVPSEVKDGVLVCTEHHMKTGDLARAFEKGQLSEEQLLRQVRRLMKAVAPLRFEAFLALTEADSRGRGIPGVEHGPYQPGELLRELNKKHDLEQKAREPLLQGRDLIALGLKPGKQFGSIPGEVEQQRDRGKISGTEAALVYVKQRHLIKGSDLTELGLVPGKRFTEVMMSIKAALGNGTIGTRAEAIEFARKVIADEG